MSEDPGDSDLRRFIEFFPKILMITAVSIILVFFAFILVKQNVDTHDIEMQTFYNRLVYSTSTLTYYDDTLERPIFGKLAEFDTESLEKAINYSNSKFFGAKITVGGQPPIFYHENTFNNLWPLKDLEGPGSSDYLKKSVYFDTDEGKKLVTIEVLRSRS